MAWQVLDTGVASAEKNMQIDIQLLDNIGSQPCGLIHFYEWHRDSATYGYFTNPYDFLNSAGVSDYGLELARRPTGGGIIFHLCDLAFSMLIPMGHPGYSVNTLANYAYVNDIVAGALKAFSGNALQPQLLSAAPVSAHENAKYFCMAKPTQYDIMIAGKKAGGGAQRRTKHGLLHQGSICLSLPPKDFLSRILLSDTCLIESMRQHSYLLLGDAPTSSQLQEARAELKRLICQATFETADERR